VTTIDARRVAQAEGVLESRLPTQRLSLEEAQHWIDRVAHGEDVDPPLVTRQPLARRLFGVALADSHVIVVRHARPSQLTLLHELAHLMGNENHGPAFQRTLIGLLSRHISREAGRLMSELLAE